MSPEKMIGSSFAAPAAKGYEIWQAAGNARTVCGRFCVLNSYQDRVILRAEIYKRKEAHP